MVLIGLETKTRSLDPHPCYLDQSFLTANQQLSLLSPNIVTAFGKILRIQQKLLVNSDFYYLYILCPKQGTVCKYSKNLNFRHAYNLCTSILHGRIADTRKRGRPRSSWMDDIKDWTELPVAECVRTAQDRTCRGVAGFGLRPSGMRKNQSSPGQSILCH